MSSTTKVPATGAGKASNGHTPISPGRAQGKTPNEKELVGKQPANSQWVIVQLPVSHIDPNPFQPRLAFDVAEMEELVASIRAHGVFQPITVRTVKASDDKSSKANDHTSNGHKNGNVRYHLIAGERRLRACKEAGRKMIPAIVRDDLSDAQAAELALLENVQRSNLTVIEEAAGYKRLMLEFRMKEERIAKKVGKSVATIRETMKLLLLPEAVQKMLANKSLTPAHGQQLLRLAPFEQVCMLVAHRAIHDHLTATSLATTLLPNARELKDKGLLVELDYKTQFDWKEECGNCPHRAYFQSGYNSYCLRPDEWRKKQQTAVELKQQEAARVLEEARQEGRTTVETDKLPPGTYRDLSYAAVPSGCTGQCPCRGEASDPRDPTRKVPVCLDPKRFTELVQAEREAHEEARRQRFATLWNDAKEVLQEEQHSGEWQKITSLLTLHVLQGNYRGYVDSEAWESLVRQVGQELSIFLSWEALLDSETDEAASLAMLQEVESDRLLLFGACLLLAQEAREAIRFCSPTPTLHYVLGLEETSQPELSEEDDMEAEDEEIDPVETDTSAIRPTDDQDDDQTGQVTPPEDSDPRAEASEPETSLAKAD